VDDPIAALAGLLRQGHLEKEKLMSETITQFASRFSEQHGLTISFDADASHGLVRRALDEGIGVLELCERLFKDYQFGLQLIQKNTGCSEFVVHGRAVDEPDAVLSDWVVKSYRHMRSDDAESSARE